MSKSITKIVLIILFLFNTTTYADKYVGRGDLKLHDVDLKYFMEYLSPKAGQSSDKFWIVVEDGKAIWSTYWYCDEGNCHETPKSRAAKQCAKAAEKYYKDKKYLECFIFAKKRVVVWDNSINPGSLDESTFKSKWDKSKVKEKLSELGFEMYE